ncbi:hypothetical protein BCAR13_410109 [Paraburkholderia caribensis]|nr:hypothetical protein BCAR13_410109 [Paraburkholderia caribensis]
MWLGPADHCPQTYRSVESGSITFTLSAITDYPLNLPVAWRGGRQAWNGGGDPIVLSPTARHAPNSYSSSGSPSGSAKKTKRLFVCSSMRTSSTRTPLQALTK